MKDFAFYRHIAVHAACNCIHFKDTKELPPTWNIATEVVILTAQSKISMLLQRANINVH